VAYSHAMSARGRRALDVGGQQRCQSPLCCYDKIVICSQEYLLSCSRHCVFATVAAALQAAIGWRFATASIAQLVCCYYVYWPMHGSDIHVNHARVLCTRAKRRLLHYHKLQLCRRFFCFQPRGWWGPTTSTVTLQAATSHYIF
jgi:hypothetical protein